MADNFTGRLRWNPTGVRTNFETSREKVEAPEQYSAQGGSSTEPGSKSLGTNAELFWKIIREDAENCTESMRTDVAHCSIRVGTNARPSSKIMTKDAKNRSESMRRRRTLFQECACRRRTLFEQCTHRIRTLFDACRTRSEKCSPTIHIQTDKQTDRR